MEEATTKEEQEVILDYLISSQSTRYLLDYGEVAYRSEPIGTWNCC